MEMDLKKKLAEAFLKEAVEDLESAELLIEKGKFAHGIFHLQQATEKGAKALLFVLGYGLIPTHKISPILLSEANNIGENAHKLVEILSDFEFIGSRTRYPIIKSGNVKIPSEEFDRDEALEFLEEARQFMKLLKDFLSRKAPELAEVVQIKD